MKVVLTLVGVILVLLMFGVMMGGITDARTDERTDTFAVTTAPAATTATVVLVADLYDASIINVTGLTSDEALDNPLQDSYVENTRTLTIRGLKDDDTRTITVTYLYGALTGTAATAGTFLGFVPLFVGIAIIVIIAAVCVAAFKNR